MTKAPSLVFVLAVATLVWGQEAATSRPAAPVNLPVSEFAKPFAIKDAIVVTVSRATEGEATTRPARSLEAWRIELDSQTIPLTKAGIARLKDQLSQLGKKKPGTTDTAPSERALLLRADADASFGHVQKVLEAAARGGIYKTTFAARDEGGTSGAFDNWLPRDVGFSIVPGPSDTGGAATLEASPEIRVIMSWNAKSNRLERLFGNQLVPATPEGDKLLEKLLGDARAEWKKRKVDAPLVIDSGPTVPWQRVVDVLNAGMRARITQLQFGFGAELGK
jgi:biopolymer transport protein ExbD